MPPIQRCVRDDLAKEHAIHTFILVFACEVVVTLPGNLVRLLWVLQIVEKLLLQVVEPKRNEVLVRAKVVPDVSVDRQTWAGVLKQQCAGVHGFARAVVVGAVNADSVQHDPALAQQLYVLILSEPRSNDHGVPSSVLALERPCLLDQPGTQIAIDYVSCRGAERQGDINGLLPIRLDE